MSAWLRFEITHAVGIILFMAAAIGGLLCLWTGLAFNPYAVPVIQAEDAVWLFGWQAALLCASLALAFCARTMVVREWAFLAQSANLKSLVNLHGWIVGHGLLTAWAAFIVPIYIAALLSVSSWLSLAIIGLLGLLGKGFVSGHAAYSEYSTNRGKIPVTSGPFPFSWLAACLAATAIGAFSIQNLGPIIDKARTEMLRPVQAQLGLLDSRINYAREDLPLLEQSQAEMIGVQTEILKRETLQNKKGVGSEGDVQTARARLLAAQIDALKTVAEARNAMSRLSSERIELETKLTTIKSAAPALKGH